MLARAQDQSHSRAAKPARMLPAKRLPTPAGHAIYAGSGQIGLAGTDHKARRAQIRHLAKSPARDRRRQFVKVQLANLSSRNGQCGAVTAGVSLTDAPSRL